MRRRKKTELPPAELVATPQPAAVAPVITPEVLTAAVRQIAGQAQLGAPVGAVSSPYLKYAFEFFKLGTELSNIFGSLQLQSFSAETMRRAPQFPGLYLILRGETVVYVGSTQSLRRRFGEHWKGTSSFALAFKGKYRPNNYREFLSNSFTITWKEFDDLPYLWQLEHVIIAVFQPMFNREGASDHKVIPR